MVLPSIGQGGPQSNPKIASRHGPVYENKGRLSTWRFCAVPAATPAAAATTQLPPRPCLNASHTIDSAIRS
jgi:hypothetical protein